MPSYIVFLIHHLFLASVFIWCGIFDLRNTILNTYMQFLCECMKIDCKIDCDARGRQIKSCLGPQIGQAMLGAVQKNRTAKRSQLL